MTVTRQVIEDLLPLYEANEASPDTRRLVEDYLALHPEVRTTSSRLEFTLPPVEPASELEKRAIEHTQKWLGRRNTILGLAIFFNIAPLTIAFHGKSIDFLLYRDQPWLAGALFVAAAVLWAVFIHTCHRLKDSGLRKNSFWTWFLGGVAASIPLVIAISEWTGKREPVGTMIAIGFAAGCLGVLAGRANKLWERR